MSREETIFGERWPYSKAKSALLRSASTVMREGGPRAATLKNIAGKAGVTEPAIFRHFDGVDGLFESLFKVVELFFDEFQLYYKTEGLTGLDRLENASYNIIEALKDNEDYCYLVVNPDPIFRQYPALRDKLIELKQRDRVSVMECLKEARNKGQLQPGADIEAVAYSFVGASLLVLQAWVAAPDTLDPAKESRKLWNGIRAIVATPAHAKAAKPPVKQIVKQPPKPLESAPPLKAAKAPAKKGAKAASKEEVAKAAPKGATKAAAKVPAKAGAEPKAKAGKTAVKPEAKSLVPKASAKTPKKAAPKESEKQVSKTAKKTPVKPTKKTVSKK